MKLTEWEHKIIEVALEKLEKSWAKSSDTLQLPEKTTGHVHLEQLIRAVKAAHYINIED
jgi:hypothetical protein